MDWRPTNQFGLQWVQQGGLCHRTGSVPLAGSIFHTIEKLHLEKEWECFLPGFMPRETAWDQVVGDRGARGYLLQDISLLSQWRLG